jgi:hypothetical protein
VAQLSRRSEDHPRCGGGERACRGGEHVVVVAQSVINPSPQSVLDSDILRGRHETRRQSRLPRVCRPPGMAHPVIHPLRTRSLVSHPTPKGSPPLTDLSPGKLGRSSHSVSPDYIIDCSWTLLTSPSWRTSSHPPTRSRATDTSATVPLCQLVRLWCVVNPSRH